MNRQEPTDAVSQWHCMHFWGMHIYCACTGGQGYDDLRGGHGRWQRRKVGYRPAVRRAPVRPLYFVGLGVVGG
jgi:hypothetical protein